MINVLIPAMGYSNFFKDSYFPKPLIEINGKTILETVVCNYDSLKDKNFIFIFNDDECKKFHLDSSVKILSPNCKVIKLINQTAGALCTSLMAIDFINNDAPLIIANSDQLINIDYSSVVAFFNNNSLDAGLITFPDIHPRWSYARVKDNNVVEVAEKRPISKEAIAGFYYYQKGCYFVEAAQKVILKQNSLEGRYYISSSINELILEGKKIGIYNIQKSQYFSFYSPSKIKEYEATLR